MQQAEGSVKRVNREAPPNGGLQKLLPGSRQRRIRENLTGYLMIFPAALLIFMFGIFPVGFALFVSAHKWRLRRGDFIGITNYVKAVDSLAYILLFAIAVGAIVGAALFLRLVINTRACTSYCADSLWDAGDRRAAAPTAANRGATCARPDGSAHGSGY